MSIRANQTLKLSITDVKNYTYDYVTAGRYGRDTTIIIFPTPFKAVREIIPGARASTALIDYAYGARLKNGQVVHIFNPNFTVTLHNVQEKRI